MEVLLGTMMKMVSDDDFVKNAGTTQPEVAAIVGSDISSDPDASL